MGDKADDLLSSFRLSDEDQKKYSTVWQSFSEMAKCDIWKGQIQAIKGRISGQLHN